MHQRARRLPALRPTLIGVGLAAGSALLSACWATTERFDRLAARVQSLETRSASLETDVGAQVEHAKTKVAELEQVLERATQVVTRSSADTGAQVEALQEQIARQEGAIAELQHELSRLHEEFREQQTDYENRMKKLARRAGIDMPLEETEIPADREQHWQAALRAVESRDFSTARALYRAYVTRYRDDARADDAQLAIGRSYLTEDRPATALGELRRVISDFQQGDAVPAALLAMGDAFYRLHACGEARTALDTLIRAHPRSPLAAEARTKLREIQRAPSGYCTS
ncbi:tetratricopeptide repeat protein [Sandaracinus amylolyticus]|uniref:tetratricopeptide repeat protein n=1 Tax=Sandaracinus amylolyticus TaxID=927083 RepID=UPI0009FB1D13|nr:tetratricopeptide repeat protein [Sandaracinus amylolyticus]